MGVMRRLGAFVLALTAMLAGCARPPAAREYTVEGQVLAVRAPEREVVIRHGDIKGFMPGMTMPFKVKDTALLTAARAGDFVTATLVVTDSDAWISRITPTGRHEPVAAGTPVPRAMDPPLAPGDAVPDAALVDQAGRRFSPTSLRGRPWALTFAYTRCPLPTFCPTLERRFLAAQKAIGSTRALADARLVSVSIDPDYDRPDVLKAHAARLGADTSVWTFTTGDRAAVDRLGERFGLTVDRGGGDPDDFVHSMRTAVVDRNGRVTRIFEGTAWDSDALVAALTDAASR